LFEASVWGVAVYHLVIFQISLFGVAHRSLSERLLKVVNTIWPLKRG